MNEKKAPSVRLNYLYNLSYQILAILLPLITTPYISRILQAEAIGAYSFCHSITTYFSLFGILGLNMYGQLQISNARNNRTEMSEKFWGVFIAKAITSAVSIAVYVLVVLLSGKYQTLFGALSIMLVANVFDITWFFQGLEAFKKIVLRNYIIKLLSLVLIFTLVKKPEDIVLYAVILHGSTLLANLTLWGSLRSHLAPVRIRHIRLLPHIRGSLVFFLPAIATSVYSVLDKSMLGWLIGSEYENGVYEQAYKIQQTALTIVSSLSMVLLPRMSYLFSRGQVDEYKKYLQRSVQFIGMAAVPIMFGIIGVSDVFIPVFLGSGYDKCAFLLRILSILILFSGVNNIIGNQCLVAQGKQWHYNVGILIGAAANFILNLCLIPVLASTGAAIASVAAEIVIFAVFMFFSRQEIALKELARYWGKNFAAALLMCAAVWAVGRFLRTSILTLLLQIAVGVLLYAILLLVMRDALLEEGLKKLRSMRKK